MELTKNLLKILPVKYHDRVRKLEREDDLIDNCKYMIYWTNEYTDGECRGSCFPVKSMHEAIYFIKNSLSRYTGA